MTKVNGLFLPMRPKKIAVLFVCVWSVCVEREKNNKRERRESLFSSQTSQSRKWILIVLDIDQSLVRDHVNVSEIDIEPVIPIKQTDIVIVIVVIPVTIMIAIHDTMMTSADVKSVIVTIEADVAMVIVVGDMREVED